MTKELTASTNFHGRVRDHVGDSVFDVLRNSTGTITYRYSNTHDRGGRESARNGAWSWTMFAPENSAFRRAIVEWEAILDDADDGEPVIENGESPASEPRSHFVLSTAGHFVAGVFDTLQEAGAVREHLSDDTAKTMEIREFQGLELIATWVMRPVYQLVRTEPQEANR